MLAELFGGAWADLEDWARRRDPEGCVVCRAGRPFGILGELGPGLGHDPIQKPPCSAICALSQRHMSLSHSNFPKLRVPVSGVVVRCRHSPSARSLPPER
jgi:hypothetical protein